MASCSPVTPPSEAATLEGSGFSSPSSCKTTNSMARRKCWVNSMYVYHACVLYVLEMLAPVPKHLLGLDSHSLVVHGSLLAHVLQDNHGTLFCHESPCTYKSQDPTIPIVPVAIFVVPAVLGVVHCQNLLVIQDGQEVLHVLPELRCVACT